jgi:hypothetical protein
MMLKVYHTGTLFDIWGIQMMLGDSVRSEYTPLGGENIGTEYSWSPFNGEYVSQVEVWVANVVSSVIISGIRFITNKGSRSDVFGTATGVYHLVTFPVGDQ